jgi:hypothetical protein
MRIGVLEVTAIKSKQLVSSVAGESQPLGHIIWR